MSSVIPPKTVYITEEDLNDPTIKKYLLSSMNNLLEMGATLKRCSNKEWRDGVSWNINEAAVYQLKKAYIILKKAKPSIDIKVFTDSTDPRSGQDYINCKCSIARYLSVDEPAKCVCEENNKVDDEYECPCIVKGCDGDCGTQACGICIDVCRCRDNPYVQGRKAH
jgi:hypothetical protein